MLKRTAPDFSDMFAFLPKLASAERRVGIYDPPTEDELRRLRGAMRPNEPVLIQTMRGEMRVLHYAADTERAYVRWVKRFIAHVGSESLEQFAEKDIKRQSVAGWHRPYIPACNCYPASDWNCVT